MANRHDDPLGHAVEDFRARAAIARREAQTLLTRAEIWEDASYRLQDAVDAAKKLADSASGDKHG